MREIYNNTKHNDNFQLQHKATNESEWNEFNQMGLWLGMPSRELPLIDMLHPSPPVQKLQWNFG